MSRRISSGVRCSGGHQSRHRLLDQLGLFDRHVRRRRGALLDPAHADEAGDAGETKNSSRRRSGSPSQTVVVDELGEEPRQEVQEEDEADERRRRRRPRRPPAPLPSVVALRVTSAFASSISSRTSSEAFSLISATVWPIDWARLLSGSAAKLLQDQGERGGRRRRRRRRGPRASRWRGCRPRAWRCRPGGVRVCWSCADGVGRLGRGASALTPADLPRRCAGRRCAATRVGDHGGERAEAGEQAGPDEALDEVVVHRRRRILSDRASGRAPRGPPQIVSTTNALACSNSVVALRAARRRSSR